MIFFYCSLAISIITTGLTIYLLHGYKKIKRVSVQSIIEKQPSVAIIIAVRNEEEELEKALQSVCNIDYNNCRIIIINDRSTDRTAEILLDFKVRYPKLNVITIDTLPDGWLGKNNALYQGYINCTEEWLLFTDADIVFHKDALSRTLSYAVTNKLDHLAVLPEVISPSPVLNSVLATFTIMLMLHLKPWNAKDPRSKGFIGIGAFNMVRREAYEKAGTHTRIKLRPDDDLQLGLNIKMAGLRQDVLSGKGFVSLSWYKNLSQFCNGLLKNSFAVANYNPVEAFANVILILIAVALPLPVMLILGSTDIRLMACVVLLFHILYMIMIPPNKWWYGFMIPFAGFVMAYVTFRATWVTLRQGGIYWRDSFYSLEMLKGNR